MTLWFCSLKTTSLQNVDCRWHCGFVAWKPLACRRSIVDDSVVLQLQNQYRMWRLKKSTFATLLKYSKCSDMHIMWCFCVYRKCSDSVHHVVFLCVQEVFRQCTSHGVSVCTRSVQTVYITWYFCVSRKCTQCISRDISVTVSVQCISHDISVYTGSVLTVYITWYFWKYRSV